MSSNLTAIQVFVNIRLRLYSRCLFIALIALPKKHCVFSCLHSTCWWCQWEYAYYCLIICSDVQVKLGSTNRGQYNHCMDALSWSVSVYRVHTLQYSVKEFRVCPALTTTSTFDIYSASSLLVIVGLSLCFQNMGSQFDSREEVQQRNYY